jgi:hypothetical protein
MLEIAKNKRSRLDTKRNQPDYTWIRRKQEREYKEIINEFDFHFGDR